MYDMVVIGAGSGGLTAARTAAKFGLNVAILEKNKIGGECLHTGCVPSKSLIHIARQVHSARQLKNVADIRIENISLSRIQDLIRERQSLIENDTDNPEALGREGITTFYGSFKFQDNHTLINDKGESLNFKYCVVATGSRPEHYKIDGISSPSDYLTSDAVWQLNDLPSHLVVVGAGPIGLELGQAFAMLGSKVTILERTDNLLPRFDNSILQPLKDGLERAGVRVLYNASLVNAEKTADAYNIQIDAKGIALHERCSHILVAVGRAPNTSGLCLHKAGIKTRNSGAILVNKSLQTTVKNIYAIGDCLGGPLFTHWAGEQGARAAAHAAYGFAPALKLASLPVATFTWPEIASVGFSEQQLQDMGRSYITYRLSYENIDMAVAEGEGGFIQVYTTPKRHVLGAHIAGRNASELIGHLSAFVAKEYKIDQLGKYMQVYPSYAIGLRKFASDIYLDNLASISSLKIVRSIRSKLW